MSDPKFFFEAKAISKRFGGVQALREISFFIQPAQIAGLIGPNGAGKTSFFNALTGLLKLDSGCIFFDQARFELHRMVPDQILKAGVARTFQNLRIFKNMTVIENVAVGFHARTESGLFGALLRTSQARREEREILEKSAELLKVIGLYEKSNELAAHLSYGGQKRLEIARALATSPKLLLLDEPVAGMNPTEKDQMAALVRQIQKNGIAILVIEHDMKFVMPLCERLFVMDEGQKIAEGNPQEIQCNPKVIEAYLGQAEPCST